jgi:hypothetical protein
MSCPRDSRGRSRAVLLATAGLTALTLVIFHPTRSKAEGAVEDQVEIPTGRSVQVDGILASDEWTGAATVEIPVEPDWTIRVLSQHDSSSLYFAFVNLKHADRRLFPEVLVNTGGLQERSWSPGQWWLHASYNLCEGHGAFNVYRRDGVFQCSHTKDGWTANNPPSKDGGVVEFQVAFSKLQLEPLSLSKGDARSFGIAFDVTDATGNSTQLWKFWPATAKLEVPGTWGEARLK